MDFIQSLDPSKLVLAGTALAFILSPFAAPPYNLPIFLFGTLANENTEAVQSLQTFTGLLGVSTVFDIIWMARTDQRWLTKLLTILLLLLKVPAFLAFGTALRQRGAQFSGLGGIRGGDFTGPTVWSMPGGFTSGGREGYQTVDEEAVDPPKPVTRPPAPQGPPRQEAPGGYQAS